MRTSNKNGEHEETINENYCAIKSTSSFRKIRRKLYSRAHACARFRVNSMLALCAPLLLLYIWLWTAKEEREHFFFVLSKRIRSLAAVCSYLVKPHEWENNHNSLLSSNCHYLIKFHLWFHSTSAMPAAVHFHFGGSGENEHSAASCVCFHNFYWSKCANIVYVMFPFWNSLGLARRFVVAPRRSVSVCGIC